MVDDQILPQGKPPGAQSNNPGALAARGSIVRRLMSKRETAQLVGVHPEHLMRLTRQGRFPKPIKLGSAENCAVRFIVEEVEAWIAGRVAERDAAAYPGQN
jgi:prophage regulatory protein